MPGTQCNSLMLSVTRVHACVRAVPAITRIAFAYGFAGVGEGRVNGPAHGCRLCGQGHDTKTTWKCEYGFTCCYGDLAFSAMRNMSHTVMAETVISCAFELASRRAMRSWPTARLTTCNSTFLSSKCRLIAARQALYERFPLQRACLGPVLSVLMPWVASCWMSDDCANADGVALLKEDSCL